MGAKGLMVQLFLLFGCVAFVFSNTGPAHNKVVVCYVGTWAVYRPGKGAFTIENIDANLCTHIIYSFAGLNHATSEIKSLDPWQDLKDGGGKGGFERAVNLKKSHPHLKVTLAIGGWNEGSAEYSRMAADPGRRSRFVKSATSFILKYRFDGLDIDWEYPTQRGGQSIDKRNFVQLCKELKESFRPHRLLLTAAFGASPKVINPAYDIPSLNKYLDYFHIMTYDYGGAWDRRVTPNAPLDNQGTNTVKYSIEYFLKLGASPSKIVLGIPFYGRTFITSGTGKYNDPAKDSGFQGPYTRQNGFLGYNEICELLSNGASGWKTSFDQPTSEAIARYRDVGKGETRVAVYDSPQSIVNKVRYALGQRLAGAMVWSIETDDFHGVCTNDGGQKKYPLLRAINQALGESQQVTAAKSVFMLFFSSITKE